MMKKLKPVLPTLREKKRYVVVQAVSLKKVMGGVEQAVMESIRALFGDLGVANAGAFMVDTWDVNLQKGMFRVSHGFVDYFRAALAFVRSIHGAPVILRAVGVSGIMKKAKQQYLT